MSTAVKSAYNLFQPLESLLGPRLAVDSAMQRPVGIKSQNRKFPYGPYMLEKLTHFRHDVKHVSFPFEALLQLAVQFAYDFVLHATCPLSYSYVAPVCSCTWNYAHRWRTE